MNRSFYLAFRHSDVNLHITMSGSFDGTSALALLNTVWREHRPEGKVFIDTRKLDQVLESGAELLKIGTQQLPVPLSKIFFKGEQGFAIAPSGTRVLLIARRKKADGHCTGCCNGNGTANTRMPLRSKHLRELKPIRKVA